MSFSIDFPGYYSVELRVYKQNIRMTHQPHTVTLLPSNITSPTRYLAYAISSSVLSLSFNTILHLFYHFQSTTSQWTLLTLRPPLLHYQPTTPSPPQPSGKKFSPNPQTPRAPSSALPTNTTTPRSSPIPATSSFPSEPYHKTPSMPSRLYS